MSGDDDNQIGDLPMPDARDTMHTLTKVGLSAIPVVGGPISELFNSILSSSLANRRENWLSEIAASLNSLESQVEEFYLSQLAENEIFITTMLHASQIAIKNHQKEKIEALKNAVLNTALYSEKDGNELLVFLVFVDMFSVLHLRLLDVMNNPIKWFEYAKTEFPEKIHREGVTPMYAYPAELVLPQFDQRKTLYQQILKDLYNRGLVTVEELHVVVNLRLEEKKLIRVGPKKKSEATEFGQKFIKFISNPLIGNPNINPENMG